MSKNKVKKLVKFTFVPLIISLMLFVVITPLMAQMDSQKEELANYLLTDNVEVGEETVDGQTQIFYSYNGNKKFITEGSNNNKQPSTNGEYITYVKEIGGEGQIFLYHMPTEKTIQLTKQSTNLNPGVSRQGKVVWEGWVYNTDGSGSWQTFLFDGKVIKQITSGDIAKGPTVNGDYVLMTRKNELGEWRSEVYSILEDKTKILSFGQQNKDVKLVGDSIVFKDGGIYPLKTADLFLFDISGMEENINISTPSSEVQGTDTISVTPEPAVTATSSSETSL